MKVLDLAIPINGLFHSHTGTLWRSVNSENLIEIQNLLDTFEQNLGALKSLGYPTEHWEFIVIQMLIKRLDKTTLQKFDLFHDSMELPTYAKLKTFLDNQCIRLESKFYSDYVSDIISSNASTQFNKSLSKDKNYSKRLSLFNKSESLKCLLNVLTGVNRNDFV